MVRQNLLREANSSVDEVDKNMATAVVILEKELNIGPITEDYLLMKFFIQLEILKELKEQEKEQYNEVKRFR